MPSYAQRFTTLLSHQLGESFTVVDSQGLIIATHKQGATLTGWLPMADKRKPVLQSDLDAWIAQGVSKLRRDLDHFTPKAHAQAIALLADIGRI